LLTHTFCAQQIEIQFWNIDFFIKTDEFFFELYSENKILLEPTFFDAFNTEPILIFLNVKFDVHGKSTNNFGQSNFKF
jgi:hypothetical protein